MSREASQSFWLGVIGAALLIGGVFAPVVHIPLVGQLDYFQNGRGDGVFVLILGLLSLLFVVTQNFRVLWVTSLASLGILGFTFVNFSERLERVRGEIGQELADNPFRELADVWLKLVSLEWGWGVLLVGTVMLMASASLAPKRKPQPSPEPAGDKIPKLGSKETMTSALEPTKGESDESQQIAEKSEPLVLRGQRDFRPHTRHRPVRTYRTIWVAAVIVAFVGIALHSSLKNESTEQSLTTGPASFTEPELVTKVQRRLNELGYQTGPVDGVIGPLTHRAIRAFQLEEGIEPDGRIRSDLINRLGLEIKILTETAVAQCQQRSRIALAAVVVCHPGVGKDGWQRAGKAACPASGPCNAWIWDDPKKAPSNPPTTESPMTEVQANSAVAVWINNTQTLRVCAEGGC